MGGKKVTITGLTENDPDQLVQADAEGEPSFVQLWREPQAKSASTLDASEIYSDDARRSKREVEYASKVADFNNINNKKMHDAAEKLANSQAFQEQKDKEQKENDRQKAAAEQAEKALQEKKQQNLKQVE